MIKNLGSLIKQVKTKLPDYLEEHGIKTRGRLFKCPNHQSHKNEDAKPSANFFPDKTSFHCFVCEYKNKLGDIFDAVKLIEKKELTGENFFEVVKYLCNKYQIPYEETTTEEEKFFKSISKYLSELSSNSNKILNSVINKNEKLKELLNKKQWIKSLDEFKLGYLQDPYPIQIDENILAYLNLNLETLTNRLIIPIKDYKGTVVGITSRSISLDKNSSEVRYKHFISYNLKKIVYNLHNIDPSKEVILVEGPSSVLTLFSYGITNVVASFGNFLHENQYSLLVKKKIKNILFLYDGDAGGLEGLRNSLEILCKGDIKVKIGFLQDNLDPGDYVIKKNNLKNIKTLDLYTYLLDTYAVNTNDKYIEKCLMMYVNSIKDLVQKERTINEISKKLKINKSTIADLINIYSKNSNVSVSELLKERESLIQRLTEYEKWSWSRGTLLGLKSYKTFNIRLDGIQNGLILLGGKPNIGKCVAKGTLIYTNEGMVPIEEYFTNIKTKGFHKTKNIKVNTLTGYSEISHLYFNKSKINTIELFNGMQIRGTPEHQIIVRENNQNIFKSIKNIKKEDKVVITLGLNHWGFNKQINYKYTQRSNKYILKKIPTEWSYDLAYLAGYYTGDGECLADNFKISTKNNSSNILGIIYKLFGIKGKYNNMRVQAGNDLRTFFEFLGFKKENAYTKTIPSQILKSPLPIILGYINGLISSNGYINKQSKSIDFDFVSEELTRRLQMIFINMGINCTLRKHKVYAANTIEKKEITAWRLKIYFKGFNKYVKLLKHYKLPIPKKIRKLGIVFKNYSSNSSIKLQEMKVVNIVCNPKEVEVYDVTVPKLHFFIANNIINHNSAVLISLAHKLIIQNNNVYLLYFTIDDSMYVTISRFIANISELPINVVSNPNYRIAKADLPEHVKKDYINRREKAMDFLRNNASFINLKDNSEGATIEMIEESVNKVAPLSQGKQLVVFIDNLHNLRSNKFVSDRHLYSLISNKLNTIANDHKCPIIASTHITKESIKNKAYDGNAIKETVEFFYDAKLILFIDTDDEELEGTRDDLDVKIIVSKNKFSGFKGVIPFTFYRSLSKVKESNECTTQKEQDLFE